MNLYCGASQASSIRINRSRGEKALHLEINNTQTLVEMIAFLIDSETKMVGTTNIHLVPILDTCITIEDC